MRGGMRPDSGGAFVPRGIERFRAVRIRRDGCDSKVPHGLRVPRDNPWLRR